MLVHAKPAKLGAMISALGGAIVRGDIPAGACLPPEHELEALHHVSRSVVREAIKMLAAKGLVTVRPRHGTHVRPSGEWSLLDHDVLTWMRGEEGLPGGILAALEETRTVIEPAAAALAAVRATAEDRRRIEAAVRSMSANRHFPKAAIAADKAFHLHVLDATHNPVLRSFRPAIDAILGAVFDLTMGGFEANLPNHAAVAAAIRAHDPERARRAMEAVLDVTARRMAGPSDKPAG